MRRPARLSLVAASTMSVASAFALSAGTARSIELSLVVYADNGGSSFLGDGPSVVTVSPNGDGHRDAAFIHYRIATDAVVTLVLTRHGTLPQALLARRVPPGDHVYRWAPPPRPIPAVYVLRFTAGAASASIVVHAQGIDAGAGRAAYHPGDTVRLAVSTDARGLRVDVLGITDAAPTTRRNDKVQRTPMAPSFHVVWPGRGDRTHALEVPLGRWASGVYFIRLRADDGRVGYAPFVLRPHRLGRSRVAVVMPTTTWQAYNFYDRDGDGRGDTWYAGWRRVRAGRRGTTCMPTSCPTPTSRSSDRETSWHACTNSSCFPATTST